MTIRVPGSNWKLGTTWFKCPDCGKETPKHSGPKRRHYKGCKHGPKHWGR